MKSQKLIGLYRRMMHWCVGLERVTACWRANDAGLEYTPEEHEQLREAGEHFDKAKKIVTAIYSARIGDAITYELSVRARRR